VAEIAVDAVEGEVDGMFGLIVHAHADEDFDAADLRKLLLHHFETVDKTVTDLEFAEVAAIHNLVSESFLTIIDVDCIAIFEKRDLGIVNTLVGHSRVAVHVN
jgi:hypothetical protein